VAAQSIAALAAASLRNALMMGNAVALLKLLHVAPMYAELSRMAVATPTHAARATLTTHVSVDNAAATVARVAKFAAQAKTAVALPSLVAHVARTKIAVATSCSAATQSALALRTVEPNPMAVAVQSNVVQMAEIAQVLHLIATMTCAARRPLPNALAVRLAAPNPMAVVVQSPVVHAQEPLATRDSAA